jgi:3-oxoacyl-[acyl-carrier protein] reductase
MGFLESQTAIVTGGTRGIGRAVALRFASEGAHVVVNYVSDDSAAEALKETASGRGYTIHLRKGSVSDPKEIAELVQYTQDTFKGIDILVNNAGIKKDSFLMTMPESSWDKVLEVNLKGAFLVTRQVIKLMIARKTGKVIHMASLSGVAGTAGQANYAASKGALVALTKSMALEMGRFGIRVNAVAPGFVKTDMLDDVPVEVLEEAKKRIPLGRLGVPSEVADAALFLASEMSSYVTGHVLNVNGGQYM